MKHIHRDHNTLVMPDLASPACISVFLKSMYHGIKDGHTHFILDFIRTQRCFPNAVVPIAAYIDLFRTEQVEFEVAHTPDILSTIRMFNPLRLQDANNLDRNNAFSRLWRFDDSKEVNDLVNVLLAALNTHHVCAKGVIEGFEWCLNEVMDNVLQHSDGSPGYVMMQVHPASQRLAICVGDHGQGIFESLKPSKYHPNTTIDAITLAVQPGITRDPSVGQGNGLSGLSEIVKRNTGTLSILSGSAWVRFDGTSTHINHVWAYPSRPGAMIDFQLSTDKPIDVSSALGGDGYQRINYRMEKMENDAGEHVIKIQDIAHGTGTRHSGQAVRTFVLNTFTEGASRVILDFGGVGMVSSSFADEFLGKLVADWGFSEFVQRITLRNLNPTIQALINHSVSQRLALKVRPGIEANDKEPE